MIVVGPHKYFLLKRCCWLIEYQEASIFILRPVAMPVGNGIKLKHLKWLITPALIAGPVFYGISRNTCGWTVESTL